MEQKKAEMKQLSRSDWHQLEKLRYEQKEAVQRLNVIQNDLSETKLVLDTLKDVDPQRRCWSSRSGVMVEMKVEELMPGLEASRKQLVFMVDAVKKDVAEKGKEIQKFIVDQKLGRVK